MAKSLAALLAGLPHTRFGGGSDPEVAGIALDSRRVRPGWLFVAVPGEHAHGARYLPEAIARGASAVLLAPGWSPPALPGAWVPAPRRALSAVSDRFFDHPSRGVAVAGVTGSNGKTTAAYMVAAILEAAGRPCGRWTTNEVWSGRRRFRPTLTSPEAPDLQRFLAEVRDAGMRAACIEVSSHAVVQRRCDHVRFAAGLVTTVTPDHLDFHGTFERYLEAKRGFVRLLRPSAPCLYNVDDEGARAAAAAAVPAFAIPYGFSAGALVRGRDARLARDGAACRVDIAPGLLPPDLPLAQWCGGTFEISVPLPGMHNLRNALGAAGMAMSMGASPDDVARALPHMEMPARRLHAVHIGPYTVIDDVAMNEASFDAVLAAIAEMAFSHVVLVVALRGQRGTEVNRRIAATLARWNRKLPFAPLEASLSRTALLRYSLDHQVRGDEAEAFASAARAGGLLVRVHDELDEALAAAVRRLTPGDALVLLGTFGMDDGPVIAARLLGGDSGQTPYPTPTDE